MKTSLIILLLIIAIIITILVICALKFLQVKDISNNLDKCENNINDILENKVILLKQLLDKIKDEKLNDALTFKEDINIFDKEQQLSDLKYNIFKKHKNIVDNKENSNIIYELNSLEENLDGLKDYYNTNVVVFNEKFLKQPFTIIYKLLGLDIKKLFNLGKLEQYEILKN